MHLFSRRALIQASISFAILGMGITSAHAAERQWTGKTDAQWQTSTNWVGGKVPGPDDVAVFQTAKTTAVQLGQDVTVKGITFGSEAAAPFTISQHVITLSSGGAITKLAAKDAFHQTISSGINLTGDATFINEDGDDFNARPLNLRGPISGTGTLSIAGTKAGVVLSGDNSKFTGKITVQKGALLLPDSDTSLGTATVTLEAGSGVMFNGSGNTNNNWVIAGDAMQSSFIANTQSGNFQVNAGATFTITNGGGNTLQLPGVISGDGNIIFTAANTTFSGASSNTLKGSITNADGSNVLAYNTLTLAKTGGAIAIAGPLKLEHHGIVKWAGDNEVAADAPVTLAGGQLAPQGFHNDLGPLTVTGHAGIDLAGGNGSLHFADSSHENWPATAQLLIQHWTGQSQHVQFGKKSSTITGAQLSRIGFTDPAGQPAGLYHAEIEADGNLKPGTTAIKPVHPAFDLSQSARETRKKIYDVPGLADLTGAHTPLTKGMHISFFGDSITWLNGYITAINKALADSPNTRDLDVKLFNHGVNGGGALQILDGSPNATFNGKDNSGPEAPFGDALSADKTDVAVLFIGINDVWWRNTTPENFREQLTKIADIAKAHKIPLVMATMAVHFEKPDGTNPDDAKIEKYTQITRDVAAKTGATLVDLRKAYIAYNRNHNGELQLDGSMVFQTTGILTYDGVHPNEAGTNLLAQQLSEGIYRCLTTKRQ